MLSSFLFDNAKIFVITDEQLVEVELTSFGKICKHINSTVSQLSRPICYFIALACVQCVLTVRQSNTGPSYQLDQQ